MRVPKMVKNGFNSVLQTFAGSRRLVATRNSGTNAKPKAVPKSENKNYNHFTPISGQASALRFAKTARFSVKVFYKVHVIGPIVMPITTVASDNLFFEVSLGNPFTSWSMDLISCCNVCDNYETL